MVSDLSKKHFLTDDDWSKQELDTAFEVAFDLKENLRWANIIAYCRTKRCSQFSLSNQPAQETLWKPV